MRPVPIVTGTLLAQRYRADTLLGRGGMGEVWRCHDLEQGRPVAVKAIRRDFLADPGAARLFHSEVVAVARLNHHAIVPVYDFVRDTRGTAFLVMEYREGPSLAQYIGAQLTWPFIADVLVQLLEALAYAHARGVLHLDIKPENILVQPTENGPRVTLLDFGVARVRRPGRGIERWFERDAVVGTIEYMPPEQCSGIFERIGPWSDIFSVGAVAFELCTGRRPFPGSSHPTGIVRRLTEPPPRLDPKVDGVPPEFADLCSLLLANEPRDRPSGAADVLQLLHAVDIDQYPAVPVFPVAPNNIAYIDQTAPYQIHVPVGTAATSPISAQPHPTTTHPATKPHPEEGSSDAERAFTREAEPPPVGAYGLFGLRDLPVLGRHEERRVLWDAVRSAVLRQRLHIVLLEGPAGIGKSRLARDAIERAAELGLCSSMQTSWSRHGSGDEGLRGLLENLLDTRGLPSPQVRARLDFWLDRIPGAHHAFAREVELLLRPPRDAAPDAALPLRVATEAINKASLLRPVLLWLDDLQWSRGEAEALFNALRARGPIAVCAIATVRTEDIPDARAYEAMCASPGITRIRLHPLDLDATRRLVRGLLDVDDELCEVLAARAEGNPLFVTQILRQLVLAEAVERRDGRYRLGRAFDLSSVPADISDVWAHRIEQSGARTRDLAALAVVRPRVSLEIAAELCRLLAALAEPLGDAPPHAFEQSIARALAAGLLRVEGGAYVWAHGLLRDHLIKSLPSHHACRLHALAAAALAPLVDREDVQEERACHLRAAGRLREACETILEAGLWSFRRADMAPRRARFEALTAWAKAAKLADLEARGLAELAYYHAEIGERERADQLLGAARGRAEQLSTLAVSSWIALRASQVARLAGRVDEGARITAEALVLARTHGVGEVERLALLQIGLDAARRGKVAEARRTLVDAASLCHVAGDRVGEAMALRSLTLVEESDVALGLLESAIELARLSGALRFELTAKQVWVELLWRTGARDRARREARELIIEASRRRLRQTASLLELQSAIWAVSDSDWRDARDHRDAAAAWGAARGAVVERVALAALDVALAAAKGDECAAFSALATLEPIREGYDDASIRDLLAQAAALAPSALAPRICRLIAPATEQASA